MNVKILGTGRYLPKTLLHSHELEARFGFEPGSIMRLNGVETRHVANQRAGETTSQMCTWAAQEALANADLAGEDLDLIIFASAGQEQALPDTAPFVQAKLGLGDSGITCFSVNSSCLSFLTALDIVSSFIQCGRYQQILIVCAEISYASLNPNDKKLYTLFGDAAAAAVVGVTPDCESSKIHRAHFSTFGEAAHMAEILGGGTRQHPNCPNIRFEDNTFRMDGRKLLRYSLLKASTIFEQIWPGLSTGATDIDWVIPHQPSRQGMLALARYFPVEKTIRTLQHYGNCVSVSLPLSLDQAIRSKQLQRGDRVLLFGTGAGLTLGGMVLTY
ncbi:ketoacyl-ACP synthase III [Nodosilinea sp. LEGE 07088]|uniref:3-oxoacyl-ACP synthase III family protein n=1 Tax=Nodosilinea sp. LEGE 07088 TaxID=2777968 RepID=UPI00187EA6B8|nr:3-oxoacyl-[acyl-carrier-protein] synthase III C-terminal domain-containing protein [Nodosilinea sp. LEGE 07088]MBE9138010.1 ketoacyl-ACP synthase III [Nodosilinea sp. LEGE 07088]